MQTTIQHDDGSSTPIWIVWFNQSDCDEHNTGENLSESAGDNIYTPGYYWTVCHPGCIPDSEFSGPFVDEDAALEDAEERFSY